METDEYFSTVDAPTQDGGGGTEGGGAGSGNFRSFMVSKESPIVTTTQEMNFPLQLFISALQKVYL